MNGIICVLSSRSSRPTAMSRSQLLQNILTCYNLQNDCGVFHSPGYWPHGILILIDGYHACPGDQSNGRLKSNNTIPLRRICYGPKSLVLLSTAPGSEDFHIPLHQWSQQRGSSLPQLRFLKRNLAGLGFHERLLYTGHKSETIHSGHLPTCCYPIRSD